MAADLEKQLGHEMEAWEEAGLRRRLAETGPAPGLVDFATNDYLGLARHPEVIAAARRSGSSRTI